MHHDAPPIPQGLRAKYGVEYGCGNANCADCYEPIAQPPAGFVIVTEEQFFAAINPRNVNPRNAHPEYTDWETPSRERLGWSAPGWRNPGAHPAIYALRAVSESAP